jgi:acyl carrier protein
MDNTSNRLTRCFLAVFPEMAPEEVATATTASVKNWDSVASVTLFSLIAEEFGIDLSLDALDEFNTFQHILSHLEQRSPDSIY